MDGNTETGVREPRTDARRSRPRRMTLAELCVVVAAVALVMVLPSRTAWWPSYLSSLPLLFVAMMGGLRLALGLGLVAALVVLFRHGRHGGPVRPAEWIALGLASLGLLDIVPKLDETVDAYHAAVRSNALDSGVARWLLSALAAAVVGLVVVALVMLRPRVRAGSRVASTLTIVGIVAGMSLSLWGPCEVARLQLPRILIPEPQEESSHQLIETGSFSAHSGDLLGFIPRSVASNSAQATPPSTLPRPAAS